MRTGKKFSVFVRIAVDGVIQEVGPNAAVVQQRVAFTGSTVADNRLVGALRPYQKSQDLPFRFLNFR